MTDLLVKFDAAAAGVRDQLASQTDNQDDGYILNGDADPESQDLTCAVIFVWGDSAKFFVGRYLRDKNVHTNPQTDAAENLS